MKQIALKIIFAIILILNTTTYAKNNWFIKSGINYSTLENIDDTDGKFGYSVGIEKDWRILYDFYFVGGVHYNTRGGIIKNITVGWGDDINPVYQEDIQIFLHYISIPLFIQYTKQINKQLSVNFFVGTSIEPTIGDNSKEKNLILIYDPNINAKDEFSYPEYYVADDFACNHGHTTNVGIGIKWSDFVIDYFYSYDLLVNSVTNTIVRKHLQSHFIRLGVKLF